MNSEMDARCPLYHLFMILLFKKQVAELSSILKQFFTPVITIFELTGKLNGTVF